MLGLVQAVPSPRRWNGEGWRALLIFSRVMNRYTLTKKLGDGTYGSVVKAVNRQTGEEVAVKKMKKLFTRCVLLIDEKLLTPCMSIMLCGELPSRDCGLCCCCALKSTADAWANHDEATIFPGGASPTMVYMLGPCGEFFRTLRVDGYPNSIGSSLLPAEDETEKTNTKYCCCTSCNCYTAPASI